MIDWATTPRATLTLKSGQTLAPDGSTPAPIEITRSNNNDFCTVDANGVVTFTKGGTYVGSMTMNRGGSAPGANTQIDCTFRNQNNAGNIYILAGRAVFANNSTITGGCGVFTVSAGEKGVVLLNAQSLAGIDSFRMEIARLM